MLQEIAAVLVGIVGSKKAPVGEKKESGGKKLSRQARRPGRL